MPRFLAICAALALLGACGTGVGRPNAGGPCASDAECGGDEVCAEGLCVRALTTAPALPAHDACPGASTCVRLTVNQANYCFPPTSTCIAVRCDVQACPPETPTCDTVSGRCYRSENRTPCQSCDYSFQCGGYWDRCITEP